jgi:hypothetical protein
MIRLTIVGSRFLVFGFWVLGAAPHRSVASKCAHAKLKTNGQRM